MRSLRINAGFTLIEMILTLTMLIILMSGAFVSYTTLYNNMTLDTVATQVATTLRKANQNSMIRLNDTSWGVHFDPNTPEYLFFAGSTFAGRDQSLDIQEVLPPSLHFESITIAGGSLDIIFKKTEGSTTHTGTIVIANGNGITRTIYINAWGLVETDKDE